MLEQVRQRAALVRSAGTRQAHGARAWRQLPDTRGPGQAPFARGDAASALAGAGALNSHEPNARRMPLWSCAGTVPSRYGLKGRV